MKTRAAVLVELNQPLVVAELEVPALKKGQVLVEVLFSGVCHTQLLEMRGLCGPDKFLPHALGHGGVGRVLEVGPGVTKVKKDRKVVLSWMKGGGLDGGPVKFKWGAQDVGAGPIATFMSAAVISENRVSPLEDDRIPMRQAAILGCAAPTGFGLVFNTLRAQAGRSLAVFGLGGIGLCAVAAARVAGLRRVVAVDPRRDRLEVALAMGATNVLDAADAVPIELRALEPRGFDYAIEATGSPAVMSQALECVRAQGGMAVIAGNARFGETLELDPHHFNQGKRLLGSWGGDNDPDRDFPEYARLVAGKKVDLSPLTSAVYPLSRVNVALDDLEAGRALRPLLQPSA
jgi:S-(hydroxymethyl)glutathione dehydrogenase/alcohol dehydrogenase